MNTVKKAEILTGADAESLITFLSTKTFLQPWVFRSPKYTYDNKEFCDVAILFRNTLILIEVTGSKFDSKNPQRYIKKVKKKHGQLNIAHRIVSNKSKEVHFKNDLFDFKTHFENIETVHKIFLSTGDGEKELAEHPENTGSVTYGDLVKYCGFFNYDDDIHSFTTSELVYASEHINTFKDFEWYLQFEKKFLKNDFDGLQKTTFPIVDSEREDLIATYILVFALDEELNKKGNVNLTKIFGDANIEESTMLMYSATGVHKNLEKDKAYREIISERQASYFWDSMINDVAAQCQTVLRIDGRGTEEVLYRMDEMRKVLEVLSDTSRYERSIYSKGILDSASKAREGQISFRNTFSLAEDANVLFSYLRFQYKDIPTDEDKVKTTVRHAKTTWCRIKHSERISVHKDKIKQVLLITHHVIGGQFTFSFSLTDPIDVTEEECKIFANL